MSHFAIHTQRLVAAFVSLLASCSVCIADFRPIAGWDSQLFPSYLISTAPLKRDTEASSDSLGDPYGSLGVEVTTKRSNQPIRVSILCEGFSEVSEFVGVLPNAGTTYRIFPKMRFQFDKLINCKQAVPTSATYRVRIGNYPEETQSTTITMRAINDCPFGLVIDDEMAPMNVSFAAYVNEQHPFLDKLLQEALKVQMVRNFSGYQSGNPNDVLKQVYAIWDLLVAREIRYSNITATSSLSRSVRSQHVRLLEDSINNTQANCVDGTVLFASMLRKIGIDACLVITSNHCYLAFWADAEHEVLYGLETTLLGEDLSDRKAPKVFDKILSRDIRWEYSWTSFSHGLALGTQNIHEELEKEEREIALVDVNVARLNGILPIPFSGNEVFIPTVFHYADDEAVSAGAKPADSDSSSEEVASSDGEDDGDDEDDSDKVRWDDALKNKKKSGKSSTSKKAVKKQKSSSAVSWE
ncbi:hypothetical protein SH449x_001057 [Pirellulaceae bacterium SH449]